MVDWSKLPDLAAVAALTCAFASVGRKNYTHVSRLWLTAWLMIALHFAASMLMGLPGIWGIMATVVVLASLTWAGVLFMWASVPYRSRRSSQVMLAALLGVNTLYIALNVIGPAASWSLTPAALLFAVSPAAVYFVSIQRFRHPLRLALVALYCLLAAFLLAFQNRPGYGSDLALNAVLFTVFFGSCIYFWYTYRRATAGAIITIAGFFAWALVFVVSPAISMLHLQFKVESEVWNLPKYVVAVGMILVLLEDQIEHNRFLALHDELTGLPNRRLFQDRLTNTLERARRTKSLTGLLLVDLNQFKQVNDTLGHHIGDLLLQHVASVFEVRVRRSDTIARTGGDEFSIILEEPASRAEAETVSLSLLQMLREPVQLEGHSVQVGASIGVAVFPDDAHDMESLCIAADLRMYDEKYGKTRMSTDTVFLDVKPL